MLLFVNIKTVSGKNLIFFSLPQHNIIKYLKSFLSVEFLVPDFMVLTLLSADFFSVLHLLTQSESPNIIIILCFTKAGHYCNIIQYCTQLQYVRVRVVGDVYYSNAMPRYFIFIVMCISTSKLGHFQNYTILLYILYYIIIVYYYVCTSADITLYNNITVRGNILRVRFHI